MFLLLTGNLVYPQVEQAIDSIRNVIENTDNDTVKIDNWNRISLINSNRGYYMMGEKAGYEALAVATKLGYESGIARSYYHIGISFSRRNKYDVALEWYSKAIPLYKKTKDTVGLAYTVMLIGVIDYYLKNYPKALENYNQAFDLLEKAKHQLGMANCLVNIGTVYYETGRYREAIEYCSKAYYLFGKSAHGKAVASSVIANVYRALYATNDSMGNKSLAADYLKKAIQTYNDNLVIYTKLGQPVDKGGIYLELYKTTFKAKQYDAAKRYIDSAYRLIQDINNMESFKSTYEAYYTWYLHKRDSARALKYFLLFTSARDSVYNRETADKIEALNVQLMEVEKEKEITILKQEKEKRGLVLWSVAVLAILAIGFSFLIFKRYREKKSANAILSEKNRIIEHKQKEITDSIHYAKRIQTALLATEKYVERTLQRLRSKPENNR